MELGMSLDYMLKQKGTTERRDFAETVKLCREIGFTYVDYSPDFKAEDWEEKAKRDKEILDAAGIVVEQTHAPFNRYGSHPEELFGTYYDRLFKASKILDAKYVVVHADEYRTTDHYDEKEAEDFAYDFLAPYVDYAKKNGMSVAIENVFEDTIRRCPQFDGKSRFGSRIHELQGIIDRFNDPSVGCCWDFGHAALAFGVEEMIDMLKVIGPKLFCTHVHDNYYGKDLHLIPFLGTVDWEANMKALREIGYEGKFSFELAYGVHPDALRRQWLAHVYEVGKYLQGLYEAAGK